MIASGRQSSEPYEPVIQRMFGRELGASTGLRGRSVSLIGAVIKGAVTGDANILAIFSKSFALMVREEAF